jgi:microcystin-dependent protein
VANVVNSNPVFTDENLSYQDTNSIVTAITNNDQQIVRNQSNLQVNFADATAQNSATISKYEVTFNGVTQEKTAASLVDYGIIDSANDLNLTVKAVDSRGNSSTAAKTVTILDWVTPTAIITANRVNNYENDTNLKVEAGIASVDSKNEITQLKYRYKKTAESDFSAYFDIQNYTEYTVSIDNKFAWDFQILVEDKFGSTTYNFTIAKGMPIMFFDVDKLSVGINRFPDHDDTLETNDIYSNGAKVSEIDYSKIYPVGSIYLSINGTNPQGIFGGTWVQIQDKFLLAAGSTYAPGSTGGSATKALSIANLPIHTHDFSATTDSDGLHTHSVGRDIDGGSGTNRSTVHSTGVSGAQTTSPTSSDGSHTRTVSSQTDNTGEGEVFSILPPFLAVYVWQRTN